MPAYRYLAADLVSGVIRDEIPFESVTYGSAENAHAPFSATIDVRHAKATRNNLDPVRTIVYVEREGKIVGNGIVWDPNVVDAGGSRKLQIRGASLGSYLWRRKIRETRDYQGVDQHTIAADLVAWAQGQGSTSFGATAGPAAGDVGIVTSGVTASGRTRTRTYPGHERKWIGEALQQLADVRDGFDYEFDVRWQDGEVVREFRTYYPTRGVRQSDGFVFGVNARSYSHGVKGSDMATQVDVFGAGEGPERPVATAADPSAAADGYPLLDDSLVLSDVTGQDTLADHAAKRLAGKRRPVEIPGVTLHEGRPPPFKSWDVSDEAQVQILEGWTQVDRLYRIAAWSVTVDAEGNEEPSVTFAEIED